jgi:hypothetical protein
LYAYRDSERKKKKTNNNNLAAGCRSHSANSLQARPAATAFAERI